MDLGHLYFDIVLDLELRISDFASLGIFTLVKSPLQIDPFMQNKPNLPDAQMSVNSILTKDYERNDIFAVPENKANSNPIKANTKPIKAKTKPKRTQSNPISEKHRFCKVLLGIVINGYNELEKKDRNGK